MYLHNHAQKKRLKPIKGQVTQSGDGGASHSCKLPYISTASWPAKYNPQGNRCPKFGFRGVKLNTAKVAVSCVYHQEVSWIFPIKAININSMDGSTVWAIFAYFGLYNITWCWRIPALVTKNVTWHCRIPT